MGDSSETLLSQTPKWSDVEPVSLPAEARASIDIQFSAEYLDTYGLLYACMARGEKSQRALQLTERCIGLCNSHYTAWDFRFQVRYHLNARLSAATCSWTEPPYGAVSGPCRESCMQTLEPACTGLNSGAITAAACTACTRAFHMSLPLCDATGEATSVTFQ